MVIIDIMVQYQEFLGLVKSYGDDSLTLFC